MITCHWGGHGRKGAVKVVRPVYLARLNVAIVQLVRLGDLKVTVVDCQKEENPLLA